MMWLFSRLPWCGFARTLLIVLLIAHAVYAIDESREGCSCVALWRTDTQDAHIHALRERLRVCYPGTPLPDPPRSLGIHTACKKFGQSCPADYVHYLESYLLGLNSTSDIQTGCSEMDSIGKNKSRYSSSSNHKSSSTRNADCSADSDMAESCVLSSQDWLTALHDSNRKCASSRDRYSHRKMDDCVHMDTPPLPTHRSRCATNESARHLPKRILPPARTSTPSKTLRWTNPLPFPLNPVWTYEQREHLENLQRLAAVYARRLCAHRHGADTEGSAQTRESAQSTTVFDFAATAHFPAFSFSAWVPHARQYARSLVQERWPSLLLRSRTWMWQHWCHPPLPALRCALYVTLYERILAGLLSLDKITAVWVDAYLVPTLVTMLLVCMTAWVAVQDVPEEEVALLNAMMTATTTDEQATTDGEPLCRRMQRSSEQANVTRRSRARPADEPMRAKDEQVGATKNECESSAGASETEHEIRESIAGAAQRNDDDDDDNDNVSLSREENDNRQSSSLDDESDAHSADASHQRVSYAGSTRSAEALDNHRRRVAAVLFHLMHHYFELEQPRVFLRWRLALYAWTLVFLTVMLNTLLSDIHAFSGGRSRADDAGAETEAVSGWPSWRLSTGGAVGGGGATSRTNSQASRLSGVYVEEGWGNGAAVTMLRWALDYSIASTARLLSRVLPTWLVTHVAAVLLLLYMGPLLVVILRACLNAHTEYLSSQQKMEDYRSELLYAVL